MSVKKILSAWDNLFTVGQWQEIRNMSLYAKENGLLLHEAIDLQPAAALINVTPVLKAKTGYKPISCPKCGKALHASPVFKDSNKYNEGFRTYLLCVASCCSNKWCGYEEFSKKHLTELIGGKK